MQWDVSVGQATLLTFLVGLSVGTLATVLALLVSLGAFWFRIAGWRFAVGLVSSFLLVPVYVQATAWSAGFGSNGWLRLSQVDAAKSPVAPLIAGGLAMVIALPLTILPLITGLTAALVGIGTGLGTASGIKALRSGD